MEFLQLNVNKKRIFKRFEQKLSQKKVYEWHISTWKDAQHHKVNMEKRIHITMTCHYTPFRMGKIKNASMSSVVEDMGQMWDKWNLTYTGEWNVK